MPGLSDPDQISLCLRRFAHQLVIEPGGQKWCVVVPLTVSVRCNVIIRQKGIPLRRRALPVNLCADIVPGFMRIKQADHESPATVEQRVFKHFEKGIMAYFQTDQRRQGRDLAKTCRGDLFIHRGNAGLFIPDFSRGQ